MRAASTKTCRSGAIRIGSAPPPGCCRSAWSPGGARRAATYRQPARSEATRVRVGVLVHGPRDNSSCSAGLNPAVSSADRRSSQLVRASHWEQAIAQPLGRSPAQGGRVVLARHPRLCRQASSLRTLGQFRCGTITGAASPLRRGRLVRFFADTARAPGDLVDGANRWRNPGEDLVYRCRVGE
jgi:hypothetical protein